MGPGLQEGLLRPTAEPKGFGWALIWRTLPMGGENQGEPLGSTSEGTFLFPAVNICEVSVPIFVYSTNS